MNQRPKPRITAIRWTDQSGEIQTPKIMKKIPVLFKLLIALCCAFITTAVFGQTTYTWTGPGTDVAAATNWGGTLPTPGSGDTAQFDGQISGALDLGYAAGFGGAYNDTVSLTWQLTGNQASPVTIESSVAGNSAYLVMGSINVESGAGALTFGGTNSAKILDLIARPGGATHSWVNNSANPVTFAPNVRWGAGGGSDWTADFSGTGDWQLNNYMLDLNSGNVSIWIEGPGAVYWNPSGTLEPYTIGTPIAINGGKLVLQNSHPRLGSQQIGNGTLLEINAPGKSFTLSAQVTGPGELRLTAGTLTLSSTTSDYGGATTLNGGVLILGSDQIDGGAGPLGGNGAYGTGVITFNGGTLEYSVNNSYDYSGRFDTAAGQAYSIDTAGRNLAFSNAPLASSGGTFTKLGAGRLTLDNTSSYDGATMVGAGKLLFEGSKTGTGDIIVSNGAALGIADTGTQVTPGTLTVGTSSSAALEFYNVSSTTTPPLAAGSISAGNTITVNVISGSLVPGQSYPLFSWSSGSAPDVSLGTLNGAFGTLSTNGDMIQVNITGLADVWTGVGSGVWDTSTANNWNYNGSGTLYTNGAGTFFDDSATGAADITLNGDLLPLNVAFYNNNLAYSVTSSSGNKIDGAAGLSKSGGGTVTLAGGANTYTGPTTISEGTLSVGMLANGGSASDIGAASSSSDNLVINGGTLQYTGGGVSSDRSFTVGTANGTVDGSGTGTLNLTAASLGYSGSGTRTLTLTGSASNMLAAVVADNGGATTLTKNGSGTWVLTGDNTYSGPTTVLAGQLVVGTGGASGSLGSGDVENSGAIDFNRTGNLTNSSAINGSGSVTVDGPGTVVLAGDNSYTGGTTINAGTLQIGDGTTGNMAATAPIVDNGTLIFNSAETIYVNGFGAVISGTGNVIVSGSGIVDLSAADTYTGWTLVNPGATLRPLSENHGQSFSSVITNNGTLLFTAQESAPGVRGYSNNIVGTGRVLKENNNQNAGWNILAGTNTYTGGTFIAGGGIQLGDSITPYAGSIVGPVIFTNSSTAYDNPRTLIFNRPDSFTFTNDIISVADTGTVANRGALEQDGTNYTVTLTGNNSYPGSTTINGGTVQVGNGGTNGTIGSGTINIVNTNISVFQFNHSDDVTLSNTITGAGSLYKLGAGALTLTANNSYTGSTVVSNGTLVINGANTATVTSVFGGGLGGIGTLSGPVTMSAGTTLAPGASATSIGTLTLNGGLTLSGNVKVKVDESLAQSNDIVAVSSATFSGSGTITVTNLGPTLSVGDAFTLFSQPVTNGSALTVTGGGATWINSLETNGTIIVQSLVSSGPPTLSYTNTGGNNLQFSWTGSGYKLQSQTNSLSVGLSTNWADYPGGGTSPVNAQINATNGAVFFRLAPTP